MDRNLFYESNINESGLLYWRIIPKSNNNEKRKVLEKNGK